MKPSRAKILLFLLISAIAIPLLVIALQRFNILSPNASGATPQLITISNLSDSTATISWSTSVNSTITNLQWGESTLLGTIETDLRDKRDKTSKPRTTHFVQLTGLQPNTTYYYRIISGDSTFPEVAVAPSSFKTLAKSTATQPSALTVYGDTSNQDGDVIVVAYIPGKLGYTNVIPLSTVLNTDGTWFLNIASARNSDGTLINPAEDSALAILGIGPKGVGSIKNYSVSESPITLTLTAALTQTTLDKVLLESPLTTNQVTATPTPTTTKKVRQDVPLRPVGSTTTATPTVTTSTTTTVTATPPEDASISKADLLASFASPSVSNVTDTSLSIMFVTSAATIGTLNWGTSATSLSSNRLNDRDNTQATARYIHHYTLIGLGANHQYYFKPTIETTVRTFTTPATISTPTGQTIITGTLTNGTGECLVRTQVQRNSILSSVITTLPNSLQTWAINVMPVRTSTLDTFMIPLATDTVLTNAFCIASNGDVYYQASTTSLQSAVTSGISLDLVKLQ